MYLRLINSKFCFDNSTCCFSCLTALSFNLTRRALWVMRSIVVVVVVMVSQNIDCHRSFSVSHFLSFKSLNPPKLSETNSLGSNVTFNSCSNFTKWDQQLCFRMVREKRQTRSWNAFYDVFVSGQSKQDIRISIWKKCWMY